MNENNDIQNHYNEDNKILNEIKKIGSVILNNKEEDMAFISYKSLSKNIIEEYNNIKNMNRIYKRTIIFYNVIIVLLILIILLVSII